MRKFVLQCQMKCKCIDKQSVCCGKLFWWVKVPRVLHISSYWCKFNEPPLSNEEALESLACLKLLLKYIIYLEGLQQSFKILRLSLCVLHKCNRIKVQEQYFRTLCCHFLFDILRQTQNHPKRNIKNWSVICTLTN